MRHLWQRIEAYFAERWPDKDLELRPPASEAAIAAAETALGVRFPDDFRESLLVHDGQGDEPDILWLPAVGRLGPLDSMVACWTADREYYDADAEHHLDDTGRVWQIHNHPRHISFAGSTYWDYDRLLFDFEPGTGGSQGQIIVRLDIDFHYVSAAWRELMEQTACGLEDGTIVPVESGADLSHWVLMKYRSSRRKNARWVGCLEYYARHNRGGPG